MTDITRDARLRAEVEALLHAVAGRANMNTSPT